MQGVLEIRSNAMIHVLSVVVMMTLERTLYSTNEGEDELVVCVNITQGILDCNVTVDLATVDGTALCM